MRGWLLALVGALGVHAAILLFGGALVNKDDPGSGRASIEEVDLVTAPTEEPEEKEAEEPEVEKAPEEEIKMVEEAPPDMSALVAETPQPRLEDAVPRLEALSLGALEAALDGSNAGGAGDFLGAGAGLASGGRIGGTASSVAAGASDDSSIDAVFELSELDQRARVLHQIEPVYPRELRRRKVEGTVYVVFVVDSDGRVVNPKVESATNDAFQDPALEAVRRWRFEPAVARGEKVRSKLRVPIRFSLAS